MSSNLTEAALPLRDDTVSTGPDAPNPLNRADEVEDLLNAVQSLIIPFIRSADEDATTKHTGHGKAIPGGGPRTTLLEHHKPEKLLQLLDFNLPINGRGKHGLLSTVEQVLKYSVNTWDQGFLDKLYASTNAVRIHMHRSASTIEAVKVTPSASPPAENPSIGRNYLGIDFGRFKYKSLTIIEKTTAKSFANLFGFNGPHAGGISTQGGSASNTTSMIIARNTLFPDTKQNGNGNHQFVLFTSAHGHYSLEKAAQMCGLGSNNVVPVPVDSQGRMIPSELDSLIQKSISENKTPFYVNATAGTTIYGSYDPFTEISAICKAHNLWLHIDASWGGPAIFSPTHVSKLKGSHLADSLAVNPHKMLNAPVTCSFLLAPDLTKFHKANTLPADYLFHTIEDGAEVWDLADLTLQCGRRGDSLKLALSWIYYGTSGFQQQIDHAFSVAGYFAQLVNEHKDFVLVSENPPPCLQVCFYYAKDGKLGGKEQNTKITQDVAQKLLTRGFMVDYASGEKGKFFRAVVNVQTRRETMEGLVKAIVEIGEGIVM
ncbi:putative glutamate decarboxylase protein [Botrytis cinerea BcDW1]|uniref:Putative glutamate decarboxylase protein n=1 Tax=Botryotinia fuckeliana (strain BcDW1) TaxID=1290391 RepID=M7TQH5_BOTF1|nr:putative glutamate decarboxylase protein [Botrytis cinerea BcDW1]